jgi:hypothetical protein
LSKQCCIVIVLEFRGATYRDDLGIKAWCIRALVAGQKREFGSVCFSRSADDADNEYAMIDATIVRAHQHSAGAKGGEKKLKPLVAAKVD